MCRLQLFCKYLHPLLSILRTPGAATMHGLKFGKLFSRQRKDGLSEKMSYALARAGSLGSLRGH